MCVTYAIKVKGVGTFLRFPTYFDGHEGDGGGGENLPWKAPHLLRRPWQCLKDQGMDDRDGDRSEYPEDSLPGSGLERVWPSSSQKGPPWCPG